MSEAIARLLEHPAIWRGVSAARRDAIGTGFAALDAALPGQGWPRTGLIEIITPRLGCGELFLLMPLLAALTSKEDARWCTWVAPPHEPFAPALAARGVRLEKILVVRTTQSLWAFEQALSLGACEVALAWAGKATARSLRRLQLAAERGRALGVLFRAHGAAREGSCAVLRLWVEPALRGIRLRLLKSRGGRREWVTLSWSEVHSRERS